jgi:microsomal epoxide hydrolase
VLSRREILGGSGPLAAALILVPSARSEPMPHADIRPYSIDIPEQTLARIRNRLTTAHWPQTSKGAGWRYGVDAKWFRELVGYWSEGFDWRKVEAELNEIPQFMADVGGRPIHCARLTPRLRTRQHPLLLMHGWPATFASMLPLAKRLTAEGYEVVVPSLPGYGFSPAPDDEVQGLRFIAQRIHGLMSLLGHEQYLIHAGDFGAVVADWLAIDFPQSVTGMHVNLVAFRHAGAEFGSGRTGVADATPEEVAFVEAEVEHIERESAYFKLQFTRPESLAYALEDSPVGWAAYMLDKWQKWTDVNERSFDEIYGRDHLLTEVMIFLVTDTVATSLWPYAGFAKEPFGLNPGQTIDVPFGYSSFPDPLMPRIPRRFAERSRTNMRFWREHGRGGHFPMLEAPDALCKDIVEFAGSLE